MSWQPQQIAPHYDAGSGNISRMMRRIEGMFERHLAGEIAGDRVVRNEKTKALPVHRVYRPYRHGEYRELYDEAHRTGESFFFVCTEAGVDPSLLYRWAKAEGLTKPAGTGQTPIFNKKERKVMEL